MRLRYDTPVLTKALGAEIKAYLSGSLSKAQSDAYAETTGSFAGSFGDVDALAADESAETLTTRGDEAEEETHGADRHAGRDRFAR